MLKEIIKDVFCLGCAAVGGAIGYNIVKNSLSSDDEIEDITDEDILADISDDITGESCDYD